MDDSQEILILGSEHKIKDYKIIDGTTFGEQLYDIHTIHCRETVSRSRSIKHRADICWWMNYGEYERMPGCDTI